MQIINHVSVLTALSAITTILVACSISAQAPIVHDPVLIEESGTYHLFCTGPGITEYTSKDMQKWVFEGPVLEEGLSWHKEHVPQFEGHIWAPDIYHFNSKYYLYYSVSSFGKNTSCIGVLTNSTLDRSSAVYKWNDAGIVVKSVPGRDLWNAIDPNIITDSTGNHWMSFGSFWEGIKLVKLDSTLLRPAEPQEWHTLARRERSFDLPDEDPGDAAIEAPFIFYHEGFYYLFVSIDYCCRGLSSDYKVIIGRSKKVVGPYLDKKGKDMFEGGGTLLVEGDSEWAGTGHCAVFSSHPGQYLLFHAYDKSDFGKPKLRIEKISWAEDAWPVIKSD